jgi:hypothetical protein
MNFKRQAQKLEQFLEEEISKNPPIVLLPDGSLAYNNFIIKKNKVEKWDIKRVGGSVVDTFNLKSCAVTGARLYGKNSFRRYSELKVLDESYSKNSNDASRYKYRYQKAKDTEIRDYFLARYIEAKQRADYARGRISSQFKAFF